MMLGLVVLGAGAAPTPAAAFWTRSQWLACSEAATAADYRRWRCWELDGYAGEIAPGHGRLGPAELWGPPGRGQPIRRGGPVSRLG